jgi:hypothetical protein
MKRNCFFILLLLMVTACMSVRSQTFVHPGIPLSGSDLSILKAHVQAGDYPWKQAYDILAAGLYYLQITNGDLFITKKVEKL